MALSHSDPLGGFYYILPKFIVAGSPQTGRRSDLTRLGSLRYFYIFFKVYIERKDSHAQDCLRLPLLPPGYSLGTFCLGFQAPNLLAQLEEQAIPWRTGPAAALGQEPDEPAMSWGFPFLYIV